MAGRAPQSSGGESALSIIWAISAGPPTGRGPDAAVLPTARPAAAVLGMLTFMATWNDFFWPWWR
jgi:hypothetical protein